MINKLIPQILTTLFLISLARGTTVSFTPSTIYVGAKSMNMLTITDYKTGSDPTEPVLITIKFSLEYKSLGTVTVTSGETVQSALVFKLATYY